MKRISSFLVLLMMVSPLLADDFAFSFGLKVSPNISWFNPETRYYENRGVRIGYSYGLIIDYEFAENYALSTGLNFLRAGGKMNYPWYELDENGNQGNNNDSGTSADHIYVDLQRKFRYHYLEIPLALKLRSTEIGYITYFGKFGLGLGFRTSARADDRIISDGLIRPEDNVDIREETSFLRAGLIIGGGLEYSFGGRTALLIGLNFHNGFSNLLEGRNKNPKVDAMQSARGHYLELTFGVMF